MEPASAIAQFDRRLKAVSELCLMMLEGDSGAAVLKKLRAELQTMVALLAADAVAEPERTSPLLQRLMQSNVLRDLCAACLGDKPPGARCILIDTFSAILREVPQRVLLHTQNILKPLKRAIQSFVSSAAAEWGANSTSALGGGLAGGGRGRAAQAAPVANCSTEEHLARVGLLNELCARFAGDPAVIGLFFDGDGFERFAAQQRQASSEGAADSARTTSGAGGGGGHGDVAEPQSLTAHEVTAAFFPLFSALTEYMHEAGPTGEKARDALLMCIAVGNGEDPRVGELVAEHSPFCHLLVVWLCARYSDLPSKLRGGQGHDWRLLGAADEAELQAYLRCLDFCLEVVTTSPQIVRSQLVKIVSHGFVFPVLRPALLQSGSAQAIAATAYLEIALRRIDNEELTAPFVSMVAMVGTPNESDRGDPDSPEQQSEVLQTMIRRIMGKNGPLCLATLRLILTLFQTGNEELFHEACMRGLLADARSTATVVPIDGMHAAPGVVTIHTARELLRLRLAPYESNPAGPNFADYIAEARRGVEERRLGCARWRERYTFDVLTEALQRQPQSLVSGVIGGLRRALLTGPSVPGDPAAYGLWGTLLRKLRGMLKNSAKLNLLLTQVVTTLAQYTPPLWQCYVFTLSSGTNAGVMTLYEVLAEIACDIRKLESSAGDRPDALVAAVVTARESVQVKRHSTPGTSPAREESQQQHSGPEIDLAMSRSPTPSSPRSSRAASASAPSGAPLHDPRISNRLVNGVLLFEELLKELTAVALEQATSCGPVLECRSTT